MSLDKNVDDACEDIDHGHSNKWHDKKNQQMSR